MKVAIVDRYVSEMWYSNMLTKALSKHCPTMYYSDKNVWKHPFIPFQILRQSIRDRVSIVHLQFELYTFGSVYMNLFVPLMLLMVRLVKKKVVVTIHGVFPKSLFDSGQIHKIIPTNVPNRPSLLKLLFFCIYHSLYVLSSKIIVHSEVFKTWLEEYGINPKKVVVIRHGVDNPRPRIILNFGVLTPRKGLETLISAFAKLNVPRAKLVIAGREMPYYQGYLKKLKSLVTKHKVEDKVAFTGFLSDEEVHSFFDVAEIVVLPYRVCVSASGPLVTAIQHCKPTIVTETEFFMEELGVDEAMFVPVDDVEQLKDAMETLLKNKGLQQRLSEALKGKAESRSWQKVAEKTLEAYG